MYKTYKAERNGIVVTYRKPEEIIITLWLMDELLSRNVRGYSHKFHRGDTKVYPHDAEILSRVEFVSAKIAEDRVLSCPLCGKKESIV